MLLTGITLIECRAASHTSGNTFVSLSFMLVNMAVNNFL